MVHLPTFERFVLPDLAPHTRVRLLVLTPSPAEAPDSSLSHMFGVAMDRRGDERGGFFIQRGQLARVTLLESLERACREDVIVALCGY